MCDLGLAQQKLGEKVNDDYLSLSPSLRPPYPALLKSLSSLDGLVTFDSTATIEDLFG